MENDQIIDNTIMVEMVRLNNFLVHNQLVQANATAQKIEAILGDVFKSECSSSKIEDHKYFGKYKLLLVVKNHILSGKTADAVSAIRTMIGEIGER